MRWGLTVPGSALLGLGAAVLLAGDGPLLPTALERTARYAWFWPVVALLAESVALAAFVALVRAARDAYLRRRAVRPSGGRARERAAATALRAALTDVEGVVSGTARRTGTPGRPRLVLTVRTVPGAPLADLPGALTRTAVEPYRAATGDPELVTVVRMRVMSVPQHRVSDGPAG
ncbi:hypothetical protein [Actinomadura flavalba]|uniref:hypothetical protein n=1 Tax=Actinomadura flavalba TaxID=1120938 RepID=UPI0003602AF3|nr:hypothetical protein [Actinomadura flavalba]